MIIDNLIILFAFITNNLFGKRVDLHGRTYRQVYAKFGHKRMLNEYRHENSWLL